MAKNPTPSYKTIHPSFKWEGKSYSKKELLDLAETYRQSNEAYLNKIGDFLRDWLDEQPLIAVQTSGSTGDPRSMLVKKKYMVNSALATQDFFDLGENTTALLCLPASYIAGKLMIVRALVLGWELDHVKPQGNPLALKNKRYDFCAMTPYQLQKAFGQAEQIKKIMVGGGRVSEDLYRKIQGLSNSIYETYAMTETLTHIAARRLNSKPESLEKPPFEILRNITIETDKRGCLVIHAPKVSDEVVYTNDLVELKSDTSFEFKGRVDHIINSGGIKINPEEIENKLAGKIPQRFFFTGLPDKNLGEKLVLFVEATHSEEKLQAIYAVLQRMENLGKYEMPKEIYLTPHFKETHTGKIDRRRTIAAKLL